MGINAYSIQVITTLLDGSSVVLPSPGAEHTGGVIEAFGGMPQRIPGETTDMNLKLGTLTSPKWLAIFGAPGISIKTELTGTPMRANPFAFVADESEELGISEIWVTNSDPTERSITILAAE